MSKTVGRIRRYSPVVKSAVSYPLQSRSRTGLSLAMFAIVIFSVTVMATFVDVLDNLLDNHERIGGGYEVIGFVGANLNPIDDLGAAVAGNPDLGLRRARRRRSRRRHPPHRRQGGRAAGIRLLRRVRGHHRDRRRRRLLRDQPVRHRPRRARVHGGRRPGQRGGVARRAGESRPRHSQAPRSCRPGTPPGSRSPSDQFTLDGVEGLLVENDDMEPVRIVVRDLEGGGTLELTVIGVLDTLRFDRAAARGLLRFQRDPGPRGEGDAASSSTSKTESTTRQAR